MTDATGTTTWNYDAASRVTSVSSPQGIVSYTYNDADDRLTMTLPGNRTVTNAYDTAGRLGSVTGWQSRAANFSYDADGNRTGITRPNGVNSSYTYDGGGRLTSAVHSNGGTLQSFTYTLDASGNRTSVAYGAGTETYTLDDLNRVTAVSYPNGDTVSYAYDANGNILTRTFNGVPTNYTHDDADQLTSDGSTNYTYDANGNLTAAGADTFSWDYADRMTAATVGGTAATYAYDGDGVRASKTVGSTTPYLWDRESGLPLLVDDGTDAFLHADGTLAQIDGAGTPEYMLDDALRSVRGVTNLADTLIGTADYDVFGAVRQSSGASSVFRFTGEQLDSETGFTFLRARYLNPALGRLTSADTVQPNAPGTQGYNTANHTSSEVSGAGAPQVPAGAGQ
jgi:RHS repeat-associated protein